MHPTHLPFGEDVRAHPSGGAAGEVDRHLADYRASLARLAPLEAELVQGHMDDRSTIRRARQVENDERLWTVAEPV